MIKKCQHYHIFNKTPKHEGVNQTLYSTEMFVLYYLFSLSKLVPLATKTYEKIQIGSHMMYHRDIIFYDQFNSSRDSIKFSRLN